MINTLTIILAIVQIIVFIFFGWLGVLQLRDYYHDRKHCNKKSVDKKKDISKRQLYLKAEEVIISKIREAYAGGVQDGLRQQQTSELFNSHLDNNIDQYERSIHNIIKTITED